MDEARVVRVSRVRVSLNDDKVFSPAMMHITKSSIVMSSDSTSWAPLISETSRRPIAFERILSGLGASSLSALSEISIAFATDMFLCRVSSFAIKFVSTVPRQARRSSDRIPLRSRMICVHQLRRCVPHRIHQEPQRPSGGLPQH